MQDVYKIKKIDKRNHIYETEKLLIDKINEMIERINDIAVCLNDLLVRHDLLEKPKDK